MAHMRFWLLLCFCLFLTFPCAADTPWRAIETEHFSIYYTQDQALAQSVAQMCEIFYREAVRSLGDIPREPPIEVWIAASEGMFRGELGAPIQDWAVAYAYPSRRRIVVQRPGFVSAMKLNFDTIVKHEIVHIVFGARAAEGLNAVPRWFSEGIAMYLSEPWDIAHRWRLLGAALWKRLIPLSVLRVQFPEETAQAHLAYTQSFSAVSYIAEEGGPYALRSIVDMLALGQYTFDDALIATVRMNVANFEDQWAQRTQKRHLWLSVLSSSLVFWTGIALVVVLIYYRRRRIQRSTLRQWEEQEAEIDPFFR